jgi:diadenosine tetraphosphate (Ap4A) HIT family hydrolase
MTQEEFCELQDVEKFMKNFYGDKKYFSFIRQTGEAKSLHHLHYHYLP